MTLPNTYRKLIASSFSRDYRAVMQIVETELAPPARGEIIIKNHYAGVNATDPNITAGLYTPHATPPIDLGAESIGEVVAVGEGVTHFNVGDPVMVLSTGGGYREYYTVRAENAISVPEISPQILTLVLSGLTASFGLTLTGEMKSGETILITAAAGGTGHIAVQLAKLAGNYVIGTCSSAEKAEFLRKLGCDRVINYREEDLDAILTKEYGRGINLVYESVGRETFDIAVKHLARKGRLVLIGFVSEYEGQPEIVTQPRIYTQLLWKSASIRGMFLSHFMRDYAQEHLMRLVTLMQEGVLRVEIDPTPFVGMESILDAVDYLQSGESHGKVLVRLV